MMMYMLIALIAVCSCQEIRTQTTYEATVNPQPCPINGIPLLSLSYKSPQNCSATFCNFRPFPYEKDYKEDCALSQGNTFPASYPDPYNFVKFRYFTGDRTCTASSTYDGQIGIYEDRCTPEAFNQGVTFLATCATPGVSATLLVCPPAALDCTGCQSFNVLADGQCHSFVDPGFPPGLPPTDPNAQADVVIPLVPGGNDTFTMRSYQMTCPKRYRKLSFWTDLPNCDVSPDPTTVLIRRISHLGETGCDTTIPPQRCESFPLNDPDPLHAYGRKEACLQEFSEYTAPAGYAVLQMWCTDPDCPQGNTPDIVRVLKPGPPTGPQMSCSGVSDLAGQFPGQNVLAIGVDCTTRTVRYYSNSDCSGSVVATYALGSGEQCNNLPGLITQENGCNIKSTKLICPATQAPTVAPSAAPSVSPTKSPTVAPSKSPTPLPSKAPSKSPTVSPSKAPSVSPTTSAPTRSPTIPWHGDVTCVKGICNCDNAFNCYCRGDAKDCMCQRSKNCYCENVSGFCFGGTAESIIVDVGNNVDCELAKSCIIRTVPPNATSGATSLIASVLVVFVIALSL